MATETRYTLDELCTQAALALSVDYDGAPNDRVREVPDRRTVRYYTTLGLIDRPEVEGRIAVYRPRQLMQLVAIKRLQSRGLSLLEIQQRLPGLRAAELESLARLPPIAEPAERDVPKPRRREFWKEPPAAPPVPAAHADTAAAAPIIQGLPLTDAVLLLAPLRRLPDDADLEALRVAAAPLLRLLEVRRLIAPPTTGDSS